MAPAAALALAAAVCFLLVAPAPARQHVDFSPQVVPDAVDREAAAEPLLPKPVAGADAADLSTALAVPEEEEEQGPARRGGQLPSLLCLVFRCDDGDAGAVAVRSDESQDGWARPAGKAEAEAEADDSDSDSDSDCESDSDDEEEEGGIVGWFWSLARRF